MPGPKVAGRSLGALGAVVCTVVAGLVTVTAGCVTVREAPFVGAPERLTATTVRGPFDGEVLDAATSEPVVDATVVGVWSFSGGRGLVVPAGAKTVEVVTDQAGRYRVPAVPWPAPEGAQRLERFTLYVYKQGYRGYRSDIHPDGGPRDDFSLRHNRVALDKWRESWRHDEHLNYMAGPPAIQHATQWERDVANQDLHRALRGETAAGTGATTVASALTVLDATALLTPADVSTRTGYSGEFRTAELGDLARTHFYHGLHLRAADEDETYDVAVRVWKSPPQKLDGVAKIFAESLPDATQSDEVTARTWIHGDEAVHAVAFIDDAADVGVLLTCGVGLCPDAATALVLARLAHERLPGLTQVDAGSSPDAAAPADSGSTLRPPPGGAAQ